MPHIAIGIWALVLVALGLIVRRLWANDQYRRMFGIAPGEGVWSYRLGYIRGRLSGLFSMKELREEEVRQLQKRLQNPELPSEMLEGLHENLETAQYDLTVVSSEIKKAFALLKKHEGKSSSLKVAKEYGFSDCY